MLITFATFSEAQSSIEALNAKVLIENELYQTDVGKIVICGMGSLNAAINLAKYIKDDECVFNFGACGSLKDLPIFTIIPVKVVSKLNYIPDNIDGYSRSFSNSLFEPIELQDEGFHCISSDFPLHRADLKQMLKETHDIVDMEGYGLAKVTKNLKMFKCISDFASDNGQHLIKKHIQEISNILKDTLIEQLSIEFTKDLNS